MYTVSVNRKTCILAHIFRQAVQQIFESTKVQLRKYACMIIRNLHSIDIRLYLMCTMTKGKLYWTSRNNNENKPEKQRQL